MTKLLLGRQTVRIGASTECELVLEGPGMPDVAATVVHHGHGRLSFVPEHSGTCSMDGQPLQAGVAIPLAFQSRLLVGSTPIPLLDPRICSMVMARGHLRLAPGELIIGRDPGKCHLVLNSPGVSGQHATLLLPGPRIVDHSSTSGTWIDGVRIPAEEETPVASSALLSIGPLPLPVELGLALHDDFVSGRTEAPARHTQAAVEAPAPSYQGPPSAPEAPGPPSIMAGPPPTGRHRTVMGTIRMESATRRSIGRTKDNDIVLDYPQISGHHARLIKVGQQVFLEDAGSELGTFVRGSRLRKGQRAKVDDGDLVRFGPMPALLTVSGESVDVVVEDHEGWEGRPLFEIEARDIAVVVRDRDDKEQQKVLLDSVSFKALPGDLIALMGPSGSGKTTLLHVLTGYVQPSRGQVLINGQPLSEMFDTLRGSIGYVPQDDIIHPELTVREAVEYSARFRLPPDFSDREVEERVDTTLRQLGLEAVAHLQIGRPEQKVLSGGQRKRVNIAMELVTDPVLLFLDEPTSGLAANDTTALVDLLAQLARESGKTIIATIHQPAKDEYQRFNLALILGHGGVPIYYGPTRDGYRFFGSFLEKLGKPNTVDNPRDMFDMLNQRERPIFDAMRAQNPSTPRYMARMQAAREWHAEFFRQDNPTFQKMFSGRRAVGTGSQSQGMISGRAKKRGQFRLLFSRYLKIKMRDVSGTVIMLAQAPIIGGLLALVFGGQKEAIPYWCLGALQELAKRSGGLGDGVNDMLSSMQSTPDNAGAIFFLVVAAVWFGTSNAAREIVSETAIYRRERMVNLGLFNYVFSKFVLLSIFCIIQCTILLAIVFFALGFNGGPEAFVTSLGTLTVTAMNSVALGLLLSTLVSTSEAAMALTPIALIPPGVLGGLMVPMTTNPILEYPMYLMPARWGFQGVVAQERIAIAGDPAWVLDIKKPDANSLENFVTAGKFHCAEAQIAGTDFNGAWGFVQYELSWLPPAVLGAMMFATLIFILIILKRRDSI